MNSLTKKRIERIRSRFDKIKKQTTKEFGKFAKTETLDRFAEALTGSFGMDYVGDGYYKTVYSKDSIDFVVKIHWEGLCDDTGWSRLRFAKDYLKPLFRNRWVSIQPKVATNVSSQERAYDFFVEKYGDRYLDQYDVHEENVGCRNGKPVIFDFENITC